MLKSTGILAVDVMKKITVYIIFAVIIIAVAAFFIISPAKKYEGVEVTFYKSPSCGCCGNYVPYLKNAGFNVNIVGVENIDEIKNQYGVIPGKESCHTVVIDGYFIEGHVPVEAIDKLLSEKPEIDGISLPNMPAGSPGMPGQKNSAFIIYSISDGEASEFMRV